MEERETQAKRSADWNKSLYTLNVNLWGGFIIRYIRFKLSSFSGETQVAVTYWGKTVDTPSMHAPVATLICQNGLIERLLTMAPH